VIDNINSYNNLQSFINYLYAYAWTVECMFETDPIRQHSHLLLVSHHCRCVCVLNYMPL